MRYIQRGSTLMMALVMLILLTLMALSAMNSTTSSIQIVGNAQFREEANAAAQQGIEKIISSNFTASPAASTVAVTFGAASYTAQVEVPTCLNSVVVLAASLDPTKPGDMACLGSSAATNTGIISVSGVTAPSTQTWCNQQQWDIRATVASPTTGANTAVHQGIFMRVPAGTDCP